MRTFFASPVLHAPLDRTGSPVLFSLTSRLLALWRVGLLALLGSLALQGVPAWALTSTTTVLASGTNPATVGQSVTLTATVTGSSPTGTVTFKDGTSTIGTGSISAGKATLATSFATKASHSLTAVYGGDSNNATSTSAALTETVNIRSTTTVLTSGTNPTTVGQSVTLTATVTGTGVTGNVTFKDGTTTIGTSAVTSGTATLSTSFATKASHSLTAVYAGDTNNATSTSAALTETVNIRSTTTALTSGANPTQVGQSVTLTATVTGTNATGNVAFKDGTTTLGTVAVSGGVATYAATFGTSGSHSLTAVYAGDTNNATSTSAAVVETVTAGTSTVTLTSSVNPSAVAQSTTLTATIAGTSPTGTVTFKDGSTTLGTGTVSAGKATYAATFSTAGTRSLTAVYAGDANNSGSTSTALSQTVNARTTTTTLASGTNPAKISQGILLTATITGTGVTGTVTFKDGTTTLGTGTVTSGHATYTATFTSLGSHSLTAVYEGDSNNAASTSSALNETVNVAASVTQLAASPATVPAGQNVTLTATVSGSSPTGTVTFMDGSTTLGSGSLSAGQATYVTSFAVAGSHTLTANYSGDSNNSTSSSGGVVESVSAGASSTSLTLSPNPAGAGRDVTLTATVSGSNPTGYVNFVESGNTITSVPLSSGSAALTWSFGPGTHALTASYQGDGNNASSTSATVNEVVQINPSTVTVAASPSTALVGQTVSVTVTVAGYYPGGTLSVMDGTTALGSSTLNGSSNPYSYTFSTTFAAPGTHNITASYSGDSYSAAASGTAVETVNLAPTSTVLSTSANPVNSTDNLTLTATVSGSNLSGTVTFKDGATALGTAPVYSGVATLETSFIPPGSHGLTATYGGDSLNAPSTSTTVVETVNINPSTLALAVSPSPAKLGDLVFLTATLTSNGLQNGSVVFKDGATVIGTVPYSGGVGATLSTNALTLGSHTLGATYGGDVSVASSTSPSVVEVIGPANTSVALTSNANPASVGQNVTLTATVTGTNLTGTVTFTDNGTAVGSAPVNAGAATLVTHFNSAGSHGLQALYSGDANNLSSSSYGLTQTVNPGATTTVLVSAANPAAPGQQILLTATVSGGNPTGTVTFMDGSTVLATSPMSNGSATMGASFPAAGSHSLTAVYSGDASNSPSTSAAVIETVVAGASTTALSVNPSPANAGANVVLTATVGGTSPTGIVTFKDGAATLGTGTLSNGIASLSTAFAASGTHSLTAAYGGDSNNNASTSPAVSETVNGSASTTTALSSSVNPATFNQALTLTATVTGSGLTGTVAFMDGGVVLATRPVSSGTATFSTAFASGGDHVLTAVYSGDSVNASSSSAALHQGVWGSTPTSVTVSSGANPGYSNSPIGLRATVLGSNPSGWVEFKEGSTSLGAAQIGASGPGLADLAVTFASRASHIITASYQGDAVNAPSVSAEYVQAISLPTTSLTMSLQGSNPNLNVISPGGAVNMYVQLNTGTSMPWAGTLTYFDGDTIVGTGGFPGYVTTNYITVNLTGIGPHSLKAVYANDDLNAGSTSNVVVVTVSPSLLTSNLNPARVGQNVVLTASVGATNATGVVTFKDGTTVLGTANVNGGSATLTTSFATAASHNLTASYGGDANNQSSVTPTLVEVVNTGPTTALTLGSSPVYVQHPVVLTATLTSAITPTGTVTFTDDGASLGTATLSGGVATLTKPFSTVGIHNLAVSYAGDGSNSASASTPIAVNVVYAPSTTVLSTGTNPLPVGQSVTLGALVIESQYIPSNANLSGHVVFMDGSTVLGQVNTTAVYTGAAKAELSVTFAQAGIHVLTAKYSGDHATSVSAPVFQQVGDTTTVPPGGMTWRYSFDALGGLNNVIDPNGNQTVHGYDRLHRLSTTAQSAGGTTLGPIVALALDGQDRISAVTDPRGLVTAYAVNGFGNVVSQSSPDSGASTATFDAAGNLLTQTDARSKTKTYAYDAINRVTSIAYATGTATLFEYDGGASPTPNSIGKLTKITDESGSTTFTYDGFGHVLTKTQQIGTKTLAIAYTWGTTGASTNKLTAIRYPSGHQVNYAYDAAGRVAGVTVNPVNSNGVGTNTGAYLNVLNGITYNGDNNILGWTWADNAPYLRSYDAFGRLSSYPIGYPAGTGAASGATRTISYDNGSRITGFTHANATGAQASLDQGFGYDNLDRLTSQTTASSSYGFAFDATGNRTSRTVGATTFSNTVDPASNRLTNVQTGTTSPVDNAQSYDTAGNLQGDGSATYAYSDRGRMSSATVSSSTVAYLYNGLDQRVSKTGSLVPTGAGYYAYDESGRLIGEYDANLSPISETVYVGNMPVAILKETGSAAASTLQLTVGNVYADHLDTPRVVTRNTDEAILWRWDTAEGFGATPPNENPNGLGGYKLNQRFPGQVFDQETGNFQNWNRDYRPGIGVYAQSDPLGLSGGSWSTYSYVDGNPVLRTDANGEFIQVAIGAVIGGVAGAIGAMNNGANSWQQIAVGAAVGAVSGGLTALVPVAGISLLTATAVNALAGAGANFAGQVVTGGLSSVDPGQVALQGLVGGVAGMAANVVGLGSALGLLGQTSGWTVAQALARADGIATTAGIAVAAALNSLIPPGAGGYGAPSYCRK